MLLKRFDPHLRQNFFGESRTPNIGLGSGWNALKSGISSVAGGAKGAVKQAGLLSRTTKGLWNWSAKPPSSLLSLWRTPMWAANGIYEKVLEEPYHKFNDYFRSKVDTLSTSVRTQVGKVLSRSANIGAAGATAGFNLLAIPPLEAAYGMGVRFPKRALLDNYFSVFNTAYNVIEAPIEKTIDLGRKCLNYVTNIFGVRNAVSNVLNGFKAVKNSQFVEAAKNFAIAPFQPLLQPLTIPMAAAAVPLHTGAEVVAGGFDIATNTACALATPVESVINGYRGMARSTDFTKAVSKETGAKRGYWERIRESRGKLSNLFVHKQGFAFI